MILQTGVCAIFLQSNRPNVSSTTAVATSTSLIPSHYQQPNATTPQLFTRHVMNELYSVKSSSAPQTVSSLLAQCISRWHTQQHAIHTQMQSQCLALIFAREFPSHCTALISALFLHDAPFSTALVQSLSPLLEQPPHTLHRHVLLGSLELACRASTSLNPQQQQSTVDVSLDPQRLFTVSPSVQSHLTVLMHRSLHSTDAWSLFSLSYHIDTFPLDLILRRQVHVNNPPSEDFALAGTPSATSSDAAADNTLTSASLLTYLHRCCNHLLQLKRHQQRLRSNLDELNSLRHCIVLFSGCSIQCLKIVGERKSFWFWLISSSQGAIACR